MSISSAVQVVVKEALKGEPHLFLTGVKEGDTWTVVQIEVTRMESFKSYKEIKAFLDSIEGEDV